MTDVDVVQGVQDVTDNNDDNVSVASETSEGSVFLGSLGIYVAEGTWDSDLRVDLDLQLGRDEWQTNFSNIEGGRCFFFLSREIGSSFKNSLITNIPP